MHTKWLNIILTRIEEIWNPQERCTKVHVKTTSKLQIDKFLPLAWPLIFSCRQIFTCFKNGHHSVFCEMIQDERFIKSSANLLFFTLPIDD